MLVCYTISTIDHCQGNDFNSRYTFKIQPLPICKEVIYIYIETNGVNVTSTVTNKNFYKYIGKITIS